MPSGYDKSPDDGGPEPGWTSIILWGLVALGLMVLSYILAVAQYGQF